MDRTNAYNLLIDALEPDVRAELLKHSKSFNFELGHVFSEPGEEIEDLYFVEAGVISAVSFMSSGETVEAYMVGREGFTGTSAWLIPFQSPVQYVAQMAGAAQRIDAQTFRDFSNGHLGLRQIMARYEAALHGELSQSGPCNAVHRTEERLAKWLLRAHDRADNDTLHMTQEFVANMLGVQRTTVNSIAQLLGQIGSIKYLRGKILVLDRAKLEDMACECYAADKGVADCRTVPFR